MRIVRPFVCGSIVWIAVSIGHALAGPPLFSIPRVPITFQNPPSGLKGVQVATGEWSGDGIDDLLILDVLSHELSVVRGAGDATFSQDPPILDLDTVFASSAYGNLVAGDFTGDGVDDAVVIGSHLPFQLVPSMLLPGLAGGGFGAPIQFNVGAYTIVAAVADLTNDGRDDIVCRTLTNAPSLIVLVATGAGFTLKPANDGFVAAAIELADVDLDGNVDVLVLPQHDTPALGVRRGDGTGGFHGSATTTTFSWASSIGFAVGNANGDAFPDVALLDEDGVVHVLCGNGTLVPTVTASLQPTDLSYRVDWIDLSGDGVDDVVAFGVPTYWFENGGAAGFSSRRPLPRGFDDFSAQKLDANLDGLDDFVSGGNDGQVYVSLRESAGAFGADYVPPFPGMGLPGGGGYSFGDLDGDGDLDLFGAQSDPNPLNVDSGTWTNDGIGHYQPSLTVTWPPGPPQTFGTTQLADIDNDGVLDLISAGRGVGIALGDGAGGFAIPVLAVPAIVGWDVDEVELADADADGDLDMFRVLRNLNGSAIEVRPGNASPNYPSATSFSIKATTFGAISHPLEVSDFDADGILDLATAEASLVQKSGDIALRRGLGGLTFGVPVFTTLHGGNPANLTAADFDGDGDSDLIALQVLKVADARLRVFHSTGPGQLTLFQDHMLEWQSDPSQPVILADIDNDGYLDVGTANTSIYMAWMRGRPTGDFAPEEDYRSGFDFFQASLDAGDVDGDGDLDIVSWDGVIMHAGPKPACTPAPAVIGTSCTGSLTAGFPTLVAHGCAKPGSNFALRLSLVPSQQLALFALGATGASVPIGVGCTSYVNPATSFFITMPTGGHGPLGGLVELGAQIPTNTPLGTTVFAQAFVVEHKPSGIGIGSSNAVTFTIQ